MTDARFPEQWLNDRRILRLSDPAFRLFVTANAWSASNRTDGELHSDDLPLLPGVDIARADELVKAGLWDQVADRWLINDFANHQTTRAQLEALDRKRVLDRERQARHRAGQSSKRDQPRDVTRDAQEGQEGQEGVGEESTPTAPRREADRPCDRCRLSTTCRIDGRGSWMCQECASHLWTVS